MSDRFYVGTRKGLITFAKEGANWKIVGEDFLGAQVPMLLHDSRNGYTHVAVEHGHFGTKLHRSTDGGKTWEEKEPPVYPEKPEDAPVIMDPWRQVEVPWSLQKIWSLETGGSDREGVLWCGTIPGGLFKSENNGDTWELVESLWGGDKRSKWSGGGYDYPGIHSICVHPNDSDCVTVAISCGGVWQTKDGGISWSQSAKGMSYDFVPEDQGGADPEGQDPHRMVQCRSNPDRYWVQHHCGIYRSDNGGTLWEEISEVSPSAFGFAVVVHPEDPDKAWFVPAKKDEFRYPVDGKVVVTRTSDGGKTFEALTEGLPQENAYDLVYRHCLDIDSTGEKLIMGSTTGSLWISENGGDSWDLLSAHLPPVFCTRFA